MIRYQIRNEYGLSDPELHAASGEEDDPEALLEGVAMAGLVGLLRQLGDLAEFAAEIFHDLHEDVMATASRGHGLMLRLQQLEAEFPAVEKAIISQTDHSNYPHDEGVDWHANLQLKQNMITQGDMPRFIMDSYEECRGPPHLFTLDKFDVAGAGASLKRYSDPSFFKTEHTSNMLEMDVSIEKKPRVKKKAIRWRKGATLESLLARSESFTTPKDRTSRKVPPRTTKLKPRHPRSPDHKTISRICREHLLEVISSQQKIFSRYSGRQYHVRFRSTDSSETGEMENFGNIVQSSGKLELTKIVPINESNTMDIISAPTDGSSYLELGDKQNLGKQHEPLGKNAMVNLQYCPNFQVGESNHSSHPGHEEKHILAGVPVDQDADGCRPDDICSDQDNFIDALNNMDPEGEADPEIEIEFDPSANVEQIELNRDSKEGEHASYVESPQVGPTIDSSPGFKSSCNVVEATCMDLPSDSARPAVSVSNGPSSVSQSGRQLNGVDWIKDEEPSDDEDLMDVSSSSSVASVNADLQTEDLYGCQQHQEKAYHYQSSNHAAVIHSPDKHPPKTSSDLDGMAIGNDDYTDKVYCSMEHGQDVVLDDTSMVSSKPNYVPEEVDKPSLGIADDLFAHPTIPNQEEIQEMEKELEGGSLDTDTSPGILASWPDNDHVMCMNDVDMDKDNVTVPEEIVADTAPTGLDPHENHDHQDGIAPEHSGTHNNVPYESYDDEIAEDMHSLLEDGLSTPFNKDFAEDNQIVVLEGGACPSSLNSHKEDSEQAPATARDLSDVQNFPVIIQGVPSQEETEANAVETLAPVSCVFSADTEPVGISVLLAPNTSSPPDNSSSCVEQHALTEMEDIVEGGKVVVAEESTTSRFGDDMVPPKDFIDDATYNEKTQIVTEEASRHDLQLQRNSPLREELETVQATDRNLGEVEASKEHISKERMLKTDNIPPLNEIEPTGEKCSDRDEVLSAAHFPLEDYQEELLEGSSHNAEVHSLCDLDKDGAVSLKRNTVGGKPEDVADQGLAWGMPDQDSASTNPFMDPLLSHTQNYPSSGAGCQPCFPEEQDFLSELLVQHGNIGAAADSLWESATPPDEAPLPSELMTEEDFRSFCREYHEREISAAAEGCHNEPASDSNNISNAFLFNESDFPSSVSALPVKLDQEAYVHSKFGSQYAECSSTMDIQDTMSMNFSGQENLKDETPGVDSHINPDASFSVNRSSEINILSFPVDLQQEQLSGIDSHSSSPLSDKEKTSEGCCSPTRDIVEVKQDLEIHANLAPHSFINETVDELGVAVQVEPDAHAVDEYDNQDIPCCSASEKDDSLMGKPVLVQESEVFTFGEFDSPTVPSSSVDEIKDNQEVSDLRTYVRTEQESECCTSGELDSQITPSPLLDEKTDKLDGPPLSNAAILDQESEVCGPSGLDSQIALCSSTDENRHELDPPPLSSSVLINPESEDHVLGDTNSHVTMCSLVKDKFYESEDPQPNHSFPEEVRQEALASPELDFQVAPCPWNDDKVGEIEGPTSCHGVESEEESDSRRAPCSSNSPVLADTRVLTSPVMPSHEEMYHLSPGPPPAVQFQNNSYKDPQAQAPPPLPPLQWRLGRPRPGLLSRKGSMPEPTRSIDPVFQASRQDINIRLDLLDQPDRSIEPVSFQAIKEDTRQSSLLDDSDQNGEVGLSTSVTVTGVARTKHYWPFSEASENIKGPEHIYSPFNRNLDAGVTSATADEEHLDNSGVTHGAALYSSDMLLGLPADEQQEPQLCTLSSDTRETSVHPSHRHPAASENDKSVDAGGGMESTSTKGPDNEDSCCQQPQHVESFPETSDYGEHITNASVEGVKHQSDTSEALSDTVKHSAPGTLLKDGNSKGSQILHEQNVGSSEDNQSGGPLPRSESVAPQDYRHDEYNLERENRPQPSNPGPLVALPGDKNNFFSGLDEASFAYAEQPPVMGWTIGPQMIHPKYGISEESQFEPNITDNHLIKKPISIKNIPRNPLVDAVASHDRSSMRKVSELTPSADKPKPIERNQLLEQIRNKTFNLKPVAPPQPTAMRSPSRANTRNSKVAAIIEKANAIRQAVGSDDEDADSWSDA